MLPLSRLVQFSIDGIHNDSVPIRVQIGLATLDIFEGEVSRAGVSLNDRGPAFDRSVDRHRKRPLVQLIGTLRQLHVQLPLIRRNKHEAHVRVASQRRVGTDGFDHRR